ncbi:dihydrofolate reductase [Halorarum halophilum]|uniref:Dihydrofolate reductase n=1 Tax=Halorarum halophilum TaxID=2743090 RepID=A0A7D5K8H3_9EURY|nr:dihydrofolate reductase family protein [Halobaculum halophilum]QLG28259.1 dihydrofolate reductase [Halobaculum halophilum]
MTDTEPDRTDEEDGAGTARRSVVVSNFVTVDGCYAGPDGEIDWFVWNDETERYSRDQIDSFDTILFGRTTYELMEEYWPTSAADEEDPAITEAMNSLPKVVFSETLERVDWENSRLVDGDVEDEVRELKAQPGEDIVIFGSGSLVQTLTNLGLIDEYRLFVNPVVLGPGKRLFEDVEAEVDLELLDSRTFSNGVVLLDYRTAESEQEAPADGST